MSSCMRSERTSSAFVNSSASRRSRSHNSLVESMRSILDFVSQGSPPSMTGGAVAMGSSSSTSVWRSRRRPLGSRITRTLTMSPFDQMWSMTSFGLVDTSARFISIDSDGCTRTSAVWRETAATSPSTTVPIGNCSRNRVSLQLPKSGKNRSAVGSHSPESWRPTDRNESSGIPLYCVPASIIIAVAEIEAPAAGLTIAIVSVTDATVPLTRIRLATPSPP